MLNPFNPRRALISVSEKDGIVALAERLHQHGVELVATGNTAALLKKHLLPVTEVSHYTGFPELLDGRVKTLHPAIHAGLLARPNDKAALKKFSIEPFDLLIVNLYPFEKTIREPHCTFAQALEMIDIGGPAMIRAAAKNHAQVTVIVNPQDYPLLTEYLAKKTAPRLWQRDLARKAFAHTAGYEASIAHYFNNEVMETNGLLPDHFIQQYGQQAKLRYGENPHQRAAFYPNPLQSQPLTHQIQGKQLSYNNLLDADAALTAIHSLASYPHACVIIKHGSPCGMAARSTQLASYQRAYETDPASSYGGILAFNQLLQEDTAAYLLDNQFTEVILAPGVTEEAKRLLTAKKNIRVLVFDSLMPQLLDMRSIAGGILVQEKEASLDETASWEYATLKKPSPQQLRDLSFAWKAVKQVKSNAIVFAREEATIGIGGGQTNRSMSLRIAAWQAEAAGFDTRYAVMASDAFIPFADSIVLAKEQGISAIIQPGGSIRGKEIIEKANELGLIMVLTGKRYFKH